MCTCRAYIAVVILVRNSKVVRLHGVPGDAVRGEVEDCSVERRACAHVIQDDGAISRARRQNRCLNLVEADMVDGVDS